MATERADSGYKNRLYLKRQQLNAYNRMGFVTMGTVKERFFSIANHCVYTREITFF